LETEEKNEGGGRKNEEIRRKMLTTSEMSLNQIPPSSLFPLPSFGPWSEERGAEKEDAHNR